MAHAVHPNYASKHEKGHGPKMNAGVVVKSNSNQRYATNSVSGFLIRELARREGVPVQEFMVKNDCPCGSRGSARWSSRTGLRTVDVGVPQLSMHSIRETIGCDDVLNSYALFKTFWKSFAVLDKKCTFARFGGICPPCPAPK